MDLKRVEQQRTELLQLVLFLVILFLGLVVYQSVRDDKGYLIPALGILSLLSCLYVIAKERGLRQLHQDLVDTLIQKERQVSQLGKELKEEHHQLESEKTLKVELEERLKEMRALYRAISSVNAVTDTPRTPESVLRAILELAEADCGSVMLLDGATEELVIVVAQGSSDSVVLRTRQPISEGIAGWVARNGEPLLLTEAHKQDDMLRELIRSDQELRSAMSVPLSVRGKVIGVINIRLSGKEEKQKFQDGDLRLASIFAQHASVAIDNSRLLAALRHARAPQQDNGGPRPQDAQVA
jgi:GAF domain-containing protein